VLDVAGGTGDIAFRIMDQMMPHLDKHAAVSAHPLVTVSDINPNMLEVLQPNNDLHILVIVTCVPYSGSSMPALPALQHC
jgi:ubiE/COQ5 methyltransferase family